MAATTEKAVSGAVERLTAAVRLDEGRPSVISEGFSFVGDVVATSTLHVEGHLQGNTSVGAVVVGINGSLKGTVRCSRLHVKGLVEGTVECDELELESSSRVAGTIEYCVLHAHRGATIVGELLGKARNSGKAQGSTDLT